MVFPKKQKLIIFTLVGFFSGVLSGIIFCTAPSIIKDIALYFLPGTIFGILISFPLHQGKGHLLLRSILSAIISTLAYYSSVVVFLSLPDEPIGPEFLSIVLLGSGGLVGAAILGIGLTWIFKLQQRLIVFGLILCSGYLFGSIFFLFMGDLGSVIRQSLLHGLFQAGAAASFSFGAVREVSISSLGEQKAEPLSAADG